MPSQVFSMISSISLKLMVIIFFSEEDIDDDEVGVCHLLPSPVTDCGGPQIPSPMTLPALCAGDISEGGEDHHDLCLHLSHVQCRLTERRPMIGRTGKR